MATLQTSGTPGTTSAGLPAGSASGDMIIVFAYRAASGTAPTLPASWTNASISFTGTAVNSCLVAYRIYDGVWTMPTFTNAGRCDSIRISPAAAGASLSIGAKNGVHKSQANVVWDTVTPMTEPGGRSVIIRGVAHTRPDGTSGTAFALPTGHTLVSQTGVQPGFGTWTKNTVTDMNTATSTPPTRNTTYVVAQVEVIDVVAVTQAAYQFYADDGTVTTATALGTQSTALSVEVGAGDVALHLRVRLQSTNAAGTATFDDWRVQYSKNAGAFTNVTSVTTNVTTFASANITDTGVISAARLTGGTGSFVNGECSEDGVNDDLSWTGNNFTEALWTIQLKSADLANGDALTFRILRNDATTTMTYSATPTINVVKTPIAVTQAAYQFFNDDGSESAATSKAAQGTAWAANLTNESNSTPPVRVRVRLQSTTALALPSTDDWTLQVEKNASGTWNNIATAGSNTFTSNSAFLTDLEATTNRLTGGTGTFAAGKVRDLSPTAIDVGFPGNGFTELVWSISLDRDGLNDGDTLRFRVQRNATSTEMTYTATPTINITKTVTISQATYRWFGDDGDQGASTPLFSTNTAYPVDVTTGNVKSQLRMLLQSTSTATVPSTDDWQLQWEKNASGTWTNVTGPSTLIDSYALSNFSGNNILDVDNPRYGQSFIGDGRPLTRLAFMLSRGTTTSNGTLQAQVFAHSGTFGSNTSVPTGSALASSTTVINATSLVVGTATATTFNFDGSFTPVNGTPYYAVVITTTTLVTPDCPLIGGNVAAGHAGAKAVFVASGSSWSWVGGDLVFEAWGMSSAETTAFDSTNLTDAGATTQRLSGGTGSFVAGKVSEDGLVDDLGWTFNNFTEVLFTVCFTAATLANGDTIRFRVLRNGVTTGVTYSQTPTANITKTGAGSATATPAAVALTVTVPAPAFSATATPAAVVLTARVPSPNAPKVIAASGTSFTTTGASKVTGSFTWAVGDRFILIGVTESSTATLTPSGFSWNQIAGSPLNTGGNCWVGFWEATTTSASTGTISIACSNSTNVWGAEAWQFRNVRPGSGGIGNVATSQTTAAVASIPLTVEQDSAVVGIKADFNASGQNLTSTPANAVERRDATTAGTYSLYLADWANEPAGTRNFGTTSTGASRDTLAMIEVRGPEAGSATATPAAVALTVTVPDPTATGGAPPAAGPTLVSYQELAYNSADATNGRTFASTVTWQTGDLITIFGSTEDVSALELSTPTASGLTFSAPSGFPLNTASNCFLGLWTATAASNGSGSVTVPHGVQTSTHWGASLWQWRNHGGIGATSTAQIGSAVASVTLILATADSAVIASKNDWNAQAAGLTGSPTINVERVDLNDPGRYSVWVGDWLNQPAGTRGYGVATTGASKDTIAAVEIKAAAATGDATATPAAVTLAVTVPAPTMSAGAVVTPAAVTRTVSVPTPVLLAGATTSPNAVLPTTVVPAPVLTGGATTTPAAVTPTVVVPTPTTAGNATVTPAAVALSVTVPTPNAIVNATATPAAVTLTVTVPAPTTSGGATTAPTAVTRTVTVPTPTIITGGTATPAAVSLLVVVPAASSQTGGTANPAAVALAVTTPAPTTTGGATTTPAAVTRTVTVPTPIMGNGGTATPAAVTLAVTVPTPIMGNGGTATPAAVVRTVTVPTPTFSAVATPAAVALTVTVPAPTPAAGATVTPAAVTRVVVTPAPTSLAGATATPAAVALSVTVPAPTLTGGATVTPAAVSLLAVTPTPSSQTGGTANATAVVRTVVVPTPTVIAGGTATPAAVSLSVTVPAPTLGNGATATPAAVVRTVVVPTPTVIAGATATPAPVTLTVTVPAPTPAASATVAPAAVSLAATVPAPNAVVNGIATPAAVTLLAVVPAPTATGTAVTAPAAVSLLVTVPTPITFGGTAGTAFPAPVALVVTVPAPTTSGQGIAAAQPVLLTAIVPTPTVSVAPPKPQPAGMTTILGCRQADTNFATVARQGGTTTFNVRQADIRFAIA